MSSKREKLIAQKTIGHSLEDETICSKDDARRLSNLLQPNHYPAKFSTASTKYRSKHKRSIGMSKQKAQQSRASTFTKLPKFSEPKVHYK